MKLIFEIDLLRSLAEIIKEKKTEIETTYTDAGSLQGRELDPDIVELCQGIGQVLKKYRWVTSKNINSNDIKEGWSEPKTYWYRAEIPEFLCVLHFWTF